MKSWPIETFRISYHFKKFLPTQLLPPTCLFVLENFALLHVYSLLHDYLIPYSRSRRGYKLEETSPLGVIEPKKALGNKWREGTQKIRNSEIRLL